MKYVCSICGFVYDETVETKKWQDLNNSWVCPICKAAKDAFVLEANNSSEIIVQEQKENNSEFNYLEQSVICSNLAKGCEKQYLFEEMALYQKLAELYELKAASAKETRFEDLLLAIDEDLSKNYPSSNQVVDKIHDRGAKRALVWSEKVTRMQSSLIKRFLQDKGAFLKDNNIYVCDICGFIYTGDQPPEICPVCKVPSLKILKVERS